MAKYTALTATFIAPHLMKEGQVFTIHDDWEPGPHVEPMDKAAKAAMDDYDAKMAKLGVTPTLHPIEALPNYGEAVELHEGPTATAEPILTLGEAQMAKAEPGLSEGGKAK